MLPTFYKRTKIVVTLGPSITQKIWTWEMFNDIKNKALVDLAYERMKNVILSGANCLRLNFSHGSYEEHGIRIKIARDIANSMKSNISLMLDTKGPEIRITNVPNGPVPIKKDSRIIIYCKKDIEGNEKCFSVSDSTKTYNMAKDVKVGGVILVDDGKLQLLIEKVDIEFGEINVLALNDHAINTNKRINLPNTEYSMPFLSNKDKDDLLFAIKNKMDYVACSFVNKRDDVKRVKDFLKSNGGANIQVISKIETSQAINNIDDIIDESHGIMVARGDLALEIPYYDVPYYQKYIIRKCRFVAKPVIVATQMLDSLEKNIHPTRAEVTDVFFAVERGADATMLSGESAQGLFPIQAIRTMHDIDIKSELLFDYQRAIDWYFPRNDESPKYAKKIVKTIAKQLLPFGNPAAPEFKYDFVVLFTNDKQIIWTLSSIRPAATIIVVSDEQELMTCFGINYGIQTYFVEDINKAKNNIQETAKKAIGHFSNKKVNYFIVANNKIM